MLNKELTYQIEEPGGVRSPLERRRASTGHDVLHARMVVVPFQVYWCANLELGLENK